MDCEKKGSLLENLEDFKVIVEKVSSLQHYNPMDILMGAVKWSDVRKKDPISRGDEDSGTEFREYLASLRVFTKEEEKEILAWIEKYNAHHLLFGETVWRRMQIQGVAGGRNWKDLKIQFQRSIYPQIGHYNLTNKQERKFGDMIHDETNSFYESDGDEVYTLKRKHIRRKNQKTNNFSENDESIKLSKVQRKTKFDKVPAERYMGSSDSNHRNIFLLSQDSPSSLSRNSLNFIDVGRDVELEQILDTSGVPSPLKDKFVSDSESDDDRMNPEDSPLHVDPISVRLETPTQKKQQELFSNLNEFDANPNEEVFDDALTSTPRDSIVRVKTNMFAKLDNTEPGEDERFDPVILPVFDNTLPSLLKTVSPIPASDAENDSGKTEKLNGKLRKRISDKFNTEEDVEPEIIDNNCNAELQISGKSSAPSLDPLFGHNPEPMDYESRNQEERNVREDEDPEVENMVYGPEKIHEKNYTQTSSNSKAKRRKSKKNPEVDWAQIGESANGDIYLIINGLPDDIDCEGVELIRTSANMREVTAGERPSPSNTEEGSEPVTNENTADETVAEETTTTSTSTNITSKKRKLKIISLNKGVKRKNLKNFRLDGQFADKFRIPYKEEEERAMIDFFLANGGYKERRGNEVWKAMEEAEVCQGRTWSSMRARWNKYIQRNLPSYGVSEAELLERGAEEENTE